MNGWECVKRGWCILLIFWIVSPDFRGRALLVSFGWDIVSVLKRQAFRTVMNSPVTNVQDPAKR